MVEVDVSHCMLYSQRVQLVREFAGYLKDRYKIDIMIAKDWEIVLIVQSNLSQMDISDKEMEDFEKEINALKEAS